MRRRHAAACFRKKRSYKVEQVIVKELRWNCEAVQEVRATPYAAYRRPEVDKVFMQDPSLEKEARLKSKVRKVSDMRLYHRDFIAHGYTNQGCDRCAYASLYGWEQPTTVHHSPECRRRMREAIRASGDLGRRRVEENELRQGRKEAMKRDAAEGEQQPAAEEAGDGISEQVHRFIAFEGHESADDQAHVHTHGDRGDAHVEDFGRDHAQDEALEPAPTTPAGRDAEEEALEELQRDDECSPTEVADSDGEDVHMDLAEAPVHMDLAEAQGCRGGNCPSASGTLSKPING